jgi:hypothetical protein
LIQLAFFVFEEHFVHVSLLKTELLVSTWGVPFAHFPLLHRDKNEVRGLDHAHLLRPLVIRAYSYGSMNFLILLKISNGIHSDEADIDESGPPYQSFAKKDLLMVRSIE